jgi:prepilin peptidase CpaA
MPTAEIGRLVVAVALSGVLIWASVSDVRDRKIPNASVAAVLALFAVSAVLSGGAGLTSALGAGAIAFAVGFGLFWFDIVGAGDAKLFAAAALFAGLGNLMIFALATALAGGLIAVGSVLTRPRRALVMLQLRGKGDFGRGIPYGVAIAIGAAVVVWGPRLGLKL